MNYTDVIFTNHAREKLTNRGIEKNDALETIVHPDISKKGKNRDTIEYIKGFNGFKITLIGKENDHHQWIVLSVWRDPPLDGTADARQNSRWKEFNKAGFWGKLWITLKQQIGMN
ncbi:MAG TPA: DUF4258 domain-containing protein [Patescibacteria group bacterium]|nr:DUF4258 domain-containing protein [Patescibacteria group bacterium]